MSENHQKLPDFWKQEDQARIEKYLREYENLTRHGVLASHQFYDHDAYLNILSTYIFIKGIDSREVRRDMINSAVERYSNYRIKNLANFRRALYTAVRNYQNLLLKEYWILIPMNIYAGQFVNYRSICINGNILYFKDWIYIRKNLHTDNFFREAEFVLGSRFNQFETYFSPILIKSKARNPIEAFDNVEISFELFRSLLNLRACFLLYSIQLGQRHQLAKYLPSPIYGVFDKNGNYSFNFQYEQYHPNYANNQITPEQIMYVRKLGRNLFQPNNKNEILAMIIEALIKYVHALDTVQWDLAFLELWQIFELFTLQTDKQIDMRMVKNRISLLFMQDDFVKDLLEFFYGVRNELVHRGIFPYRQGLEAVGLLKSIVERSFRTMLYLSTFFKTENDLLLFYEFESKNDADLVRRVHAIRKIQAIRKK